MTYILSRICGKAQHETDPDILAHVAQLPPELQIHIFKDLGSRTRRNMIHAAILSEKPSVFARIRDLLVPSKPKPISATQILRASESTSFRDHIKHFTDHFGFLLTPDELALCRRLESNLLRFEGNLLDPVRRKSARAAFEQDCREDLDRFRVIEEKVQDTTNLANRGIEDLIDSGAGDPQTAISGLKNIPLFLDSDFMKLFGQKHLERAINRGNPEIVEALLKQGALPKEPDKADALLVHALRCNSPEILNLLLRAKAIPGSLSLIAALKKKDDLAFYKLISAIPPEERKDLINRIKIRPPFGPETTLLGFALMSQMSYSAKILLMNGADPNTPAGGTLPLHIASQFFDSEMTNYLLSYGADPNARVQGMSALCLAASLNRAETVEMLLRPRSAQFRATSVGDEAEFLLNLAIQTCNNVRMAKALLEHISPNRESIAIRPEWMAHAVQKGNLEMVELLYKYGGSVTGNGEPTLLCQAIAGNHTGIVQFLLRAGAKIDPGAMKTAIQNQKAHPILLSILLQKGGSPNFLDEAIRCKNPAAFEQLLQAGASPDIGCVEPPIIAAIRQSNLALVNRLFEVKADCRSLESEIAKALEETENKYLNFMAYWEDQASRTPYTFGDEEYYAYSGTLLPAHRQIAKLIAERAPKTTLS